MRAGTGARRLGLAALRLILTALLAGVMYAALAGFDRDGQSLNRLMRALHEGVSSAAPALVLLHGIFAEKDHWVDFARPLTGQYRVVFNGFGGRLSPSVGGHRPIAP